MVEPVSVGASIGYMVLIALFVAAMSLLVLSRGGYYTQSRRKTPDFSRGRMSLLGDVCSFEYTYSQCSKSSFRYSRVPRF